MTNSKINQAKSALGAIRRNIYKYKNYPLGAVKKIFTGCVQPILIYGSKIPTIKGETKRIDIIISSLEKEFWSIKKSSNVMATLAEVGWTPSSVIAKERRLYTI